MASFSTDAKAACISCLGWCCPNLSTLVLVEMDPSRGLTPQSVAQVLDERATRGFQVLRHLIVGPPGAIEPVSEDWECLRSRVLELSLEHQLWNKPNWFTWTWFDR